MKNEKSLYTDNNLFLIYKILLIVIVTALLGEIKITVFDSPFRFALGSAAFLFFLLYYKKVPYSFIGILTGTSITLFRIFLDYFSKVNFEFFTSFFEHSPIIGYYFIFSLIFSLFNKSKYNTNSFYLCLAGALSDIIANFIELTFRTAASEEILISSNLIMYVILIGFLRSFFVVGLYNMIKFNHFKGVYEEQQRKFEQIQLINSTLYIEGFYLKKIMKEIEDLTGKSYKLYSELKKNDDISNENSKLALSVAQEVHEVKKDTQRILAGLEKLINKENKLGDISILDICKLIINSNQSYSVHLKKDIEYNYTVHSKKRIVNIYPLLVIINNLIENSVEAIDNSGYIKLIVKENKSYIEFYIIDNGSGIIEEEKNIIFEPGFTTKFADDGKSNTGIGLSHVKSLVNNLNGSIEVSNNSNETHFKVILPIENLNVEGNI